MIIATEFENFGTLNDMYKFMCLEKKKSIFIKYVDFWGIKFLRGYGLSKLEVEEMLENNFDVCAYGKNNWGF